MTKHHKSLRKDKRAVSPAFSTMILTAAVIVMLVVAMSYASNILNLRLAENEVSANKQFMQTGGAQIDDIAWTIGRTQTITYSSKFGSMNYQELALSYTFEFQNASGLFALTVPIETGVVLYNMPIASYTLNNNSYFQRVPNTASGSFLLSGPSAPISQVLFEQKVPMSDGAYVRVVLVPTIRVMASTMSGISCYKFYLPTLEGGSFPYRTQSLTLTGEGISKFSKSGVDGVRISVSFPKDTLGFDSSFFNFQSTSVTLNSTSTPKINAGSFVEFYTGKVLVNIGQV
jgi:hypothetical protein